MKNYILTQCKLSDIDRLEQLFAVPKAGEHNMRWVLPEWLLALRQAAYEQHKLRNCFLEGSQAFWTYLAQPKAYPVPEAPYSPGTPAAVEWEVGWEDAFLYNRGDWE